MEATEQVEVTSHRAVRRTDSNAILGVVGADWTPVQNQELFAWLDALGAWGDMTVETAGCLDNGRTVWALARMDDLGWELGTSDKINPYLLLSNGHAGNRALSIVPTSVRVVCANTMRMSDVQTDRRHAKHGDGLSAGWKLVHTTDIKGHMDKARDILLRTTDSWKATQQEMERLAQAGLDSALLESIAEKVWKGEDVEKDGTPSKQAKAIMADRVSEIHKILASPTCTTPAAKGTAWGMLNAFTEYLDHENPIRVSKGKDPQEARFASTQFGRADVLKGKAWKTIRELVAG